MDGTPRGGWGQGEGVFWIGLLWFGLVVLGLTGGVEGCGFDLF